MTRLSICYVAPRALACLRDGPVGLGGAERQQAIVAKELARRGHRVGFVVEAEGPGGPATEDLGGLAVIRMQAHPRIAPRAACGAGQAALRGAWRLARLTRALYAALEAADAEIYCVRSEHLRAALVSAWCRTWGRRFVFACGHDGNCDPELAHRRPRRAIQAAYAAALRAADAVVAQGTAQREMMRRRLGVVPDVIPGAVALDPRPRGGPRRGVVWIGCLEPRKGVDRLLDVAASAPGVEFTVVGGPGDHPVYAEECERRARRLANVTWRGPLPNGRAMDLLGRSALLLNTSRSEGFPNTFLEAWREATPVVSQSIDPDGLLARAGLGVVSGGAEETVRAILALIGDPRRREAIARRARRHLESRHGLDEVAGLWEGAFARAAARRAPRERAAA